MKTILFLIALFALAFSKVAAAIVSSEIHTSTEFNATPKVWTALVQPGGSSAGSNNWEMSLNPVAGNTVTDDVIWSYDANLPVILTYPGGDLHFSFNGHSMDPNTVTPSIGWSHLWIGAFANGGLYPGVTMTFKNLVLNGQSLTETIVITRASNQPSNFYGLDLSNFGTFQNFSGDLVYTKFGGFAGAATNDFQLKIAGTNVAALMPEPGSISLLLTGVICFANRRHRKNTIS